MPIYNIAWRHKRHQDGPFRGELITREFESTSVYRHSYPEAKDVGGAIAQLLGDINTAQDPRNRRVYLGDIEIKHCYEWTQVMNDGHKPTEDVATEVGGHRKNMTVLSVAYQLSELKVALAVAEKFNSVHTSSFIGEVKRRIKVLKRIADEGVLTLPEVIDLAKGLKGKARWEGYSEGDRSIALDDALDVANVVHKSYEAAGLLKSQPAF